MADDSAQSVVATLREHVPPLVPGLTGYLNRGIDLLDIAYGRSRGLIAMARAETNDGFTGYAPSPEATGRAGAEAKSLSRTRTGQRG